MNNCTLLTQESGITRLWYMLMNNYTVLAPQTCIVRLWDVFENSERIFLVMELAEGGELFDRITGNGRLPEPVTKFYCYQLALAIHHLHERGITHRDIKVGSWPQLYN